MENTDVRKKQNYRESKQERRELTKYSGKTTAKDKYTTTKKDKVRKELKQERQRTTEIANKVGEN